MSKRIIDLKGLKFGRLLVTEFSHLDKHKRARWNCNCDCGNKKIIAGVHLKNKRTLSCGCLLDEYMNKTNRKHGKVYSKVYITYYNIIARCNNKKNTHYKYYGGRGIKCEWESFEDFYNDMGDVPKGKSIDRINNDGNYCKENCRWSTKKQQSNNQRSNIKYKGLTPNQISDKTGIPIQTIYWRLKNNKEIRL
ncbi:MAG: AP2 domain-containing protein [Candidatus Heimdallarchaeaceae archaeon]